MNATPAPKLVLLPVTFTPQIQNHCGPAVLSMAAGYATGTYPNIHEVSKTVFTPEREGTLRFAMVSGARRMGLLAVQLNRFENILMEVASGNPVILFENRGLSFAPVWHFSLLVGYNLNADTAVLHSDQDAFTTMPLDQLAHIWNRGGRWAMIVTPPDRLPNVHDSEALIAGAHGLSRAQQPQLAYLAFAQIAQRFPANHLAQFTYGNAALALGRLNEAENALRQAIKLGDPKGSAHNNLAYVFAKQDRKADACQTARAAQRIAPQNAGIADTVQELCGSRSDN